MCTELIFQGVYRACISGCVQSLYFRVYTELTFQGVYRAYISECTDLVFQGVYRAYISGCIKSLYFRVYTDLVFQSVQSLYFRKNGITFFLNAILYLIVRFRTAIFFDTSESFFLKILKVNSDFICLKGVILELKMFHWAVLLDVLLLKEIQLTQPALPYDYKCFADGYSICVRNIQNRLLYTR